MGGRAAMMEGDVSTIDLLARLVELGREKFTGAIRFENEGIIKILYLKGGDILSASTNDRADSVDELLLRAGKVTREHVKQALAKRKESETLGDALLNLGFITRKELTWGRRVQVISVIRSVRSWTTGSYTIVADYLPKREEGTLFALQQVIVELIVTEQDRSEVERAMEGGAAVFRKAADFDEHYRTLGLNEDADAVVAEVDGERSASEVAALAGRDAFNVYKLLRAFAILGLTERVGAPSPTVQVPMIGGTDELLSTGISAPAQPAWSSPPASSATVAVPMPAMAATEEFGDAPTLEIPMKESLPAEIPKAKPKPAAVRPAERIATPAPRRMPTQSRSSRPVLSAPKKEKKSSAPLLVILLLAILGGGGWYGWQWWQAKQASAKPVVIAAKPKPAPAIVPTTTTAASPIAPPVTTTTQAPVAVTPKPMPTPTPKPIPIAPKPAPVVPKPAPSTDRYADMAREYERTAKGTYTVQFELVCQSSSLAKAIEAGGQKVWFVPISYKGQSCYRVFWGRFETREAAALAVPAIPRELRGPAPAIVRVQ